MGTRRNYAPPWKWTASGTPRLTLKSGFPVTNPDQIPLVSNSATTYSEYKVYGRGVGQQYWSGNKQIGESDAEWYFRYTFDGDIPQVLNPGDKLFIPLHADASGQKMNYHIGNTLTMYASGFDVQCNPPTGSYRRPYVFAGRAGNATLILKDDRNCMLTVPDNPPQFMSLSFHIGGWGTAIVYEWEIAPTL